VVFNSGGVWANGLWLAELFEGDDKMQKWQDFCSAPEEEQRKILYGIHKAAPTTAKRALVPRERYDRIDRRVKTLLKVSLPLLGPCLWLLAACAAFSFCRWTLHKDDLLYISYISNSAMYMSKS